MKKCFTFIFWLLMSIVILPQDYSIDGYYQTYFPAEPIFHKEVDLDDFYTKSFRYLDKKNMLLYFATYNFHKKDISKYKTEALLDGVVKGEVLGTKGALISKKIVEVSGYKGVIFVLKFKTNDYSVLKYCITVIKKNIFCGWSIQEFVGTSKIKASAVFDSKIKHFKILD